MRYFPKYKLFQFRAAYKYLQLGVMYSHKFEYKKSRKLWIQFFTQVDRLFYRDRYAVEHFDAVIAGADIVVGLITAIRMAKSGKRVLVYPDIQDDMFDGYYSLCERRFTTYMQGFEVLAGLDGDISSCEDMISALTTKASSYYDDLGMPLIMVVNEKSTVVTSISENPDGIQDFWLETEMESNRFEKIEYWRGIFANSHEFALLSRDVGLMKRYGTSSPKCLIQSLALIKTSFLSNSFPAKVNCVEFDLSEASNSILNFDQFTFNDRIVDIVETNKIR